MKNYFVTTVLVVPPKIVWNVPKGTILINPIILVGLVRMDVKDVQVPKLVMYAKKELSNLFKKTVNSVMLESLVTENNALLELYQVFLLLFTKIPKFS
jgi:hypothetical protein